MAEAWKPIQDPASEQEARKGMFCDSLEWLRWAIWCDPIYTLDEKIQPSLFRFLHMQVSVTKGDKGDQKVLIQGDLSQFD